ncbi:GNAT family N-acetyltransferase [Meiothermus rufus]|uniref:GNAT family N-acetyltransferase n=1 Tax=Meiothermus rufus TaxID=604332 RepID=UPI0004224E0F|nr:GNAT family N-acetyltransferase [Meiothermus rufus]
MTFVIRPYAPQDLPQLYYICLLTGDSGADARALYRDPDLLGHFYAAPYVRFEPDLALVLSDAQGVCGYVLGCRDSQRFADWMEGVWLPPLRRQYPLPSPDDTSRDAALIRLIHQWYLPSRWAQEYPAHLHIDLLPRAQGQGQGRRLMQTFLERLRQLGVPGVHLGVGQRNQRAIAFYQRMGFTLLEAHPWGFEYGMKLCPGSPAS